MDMSSQMLIFAKVVDHGSISAAARAMGQTPSAVSKQIGFLEDRVRNRLLNRTKDGVSPTSEGREFYEKCAALAEKFNEAEAHMLSLDGTPRGKLRIASSVAFGKYQLVPLIPKFLAKYPEVQISLEATDRQVDLAVEGFDAVICIAEQRQDPDVVAKKIRTSRRLLCASPEYLQRNGTPSSFEDLSNHNCLGITGGVERNHWGQSTRGALASLPQTGNFEGNSIDIAFRAALAGLGIARVPCYLVATELQSGELVRVLPDFSQENSEISIVFAAKRNLAPKIRVFVDFLAEEFR
jgi:DNA-binding transcriptional LysR family regulator